LVRIAGHRCLLLLLPTTDRRQQLSFSNTTTPYHTSRIMFGLFIDFMVYIFASLLLVYTGGKTYLETC
jgi:hypothetical protein